MRSKSKLNFLVYFFLKTVNYSQMLVVMTYNIWMIVALVVAQSLANFVARKKGMKISMSHH